MAKNKKDFPTFTETELQLFNIGEEGLKKIKPTFEVLKEKLINGAELLEREKDFFCRAAKHYEDPLFNDICCNNFLFKDLYRNYFHDLTGGSTYIKYNGVVSVTDAQNDLNYLYALADEWENVINKTNHSNELLQQSTSEARKDLKSLSQLPEFNSYPYEKGSFRYIFKKRSIILQSKYIYCLALEILEGLDVNDLLLEINGQQIEFNEFTLIHILNRHYARIVKQFDAGKSYHTEDFRPELLSKELQNILMKIDESQMLSNSSIDKIAFQFKGNDYLLWTSNETKFVKGTKGGINYIRLNTFYPLTDEEEIKKITQCELNKIDDELSVYILS